MYKGEVFTYKRKRTQIHMNNYFNDSFYLCALVHIKIYVLNMKKNCRKCDLLSKYLKIHMFNPILLSTSFLNTIFVLSVTSRTRQTASRCSQFVLNSIKIHHAEFVALVFINKRLTFYHKISSRDS